MIPRIIAGIEHNTQRQKLLITPKIKLKSAAIEAFFSGITDSSELCEDCSPVIVNTHSEHAENLVFRKE